jgi:cytoskeleton protein RodZ
MTDSVSDSGGDGTATPAPMGCAPAAGSAGALLRQAREQQGMHIAVLAAAIKVSPRKLDALEGDRYSELPDATFTRALAQAVCRVLKMDPQPVLALLPTVKASGLESVGEGLNTPFRTRGSSGDRGLNLPRGPLIWGALILLVAAGLVMYWPTPEADLSNLLTPPAASEAQVPAATAAPTAEAAASEAAVPALAASTPASAAASQAQASAVSSGIQAVAGSPSVAEAPVAAPTDAGASLSVSEEVWAEVIDGDGRVVFQRTIQPGETLSFEQKPPLKLKIGNASAARLSYRGDPVDLVPLTRGNVARVELP